MDALMREHTSARDSGQMHACDRGMQTTEAAMTRSEMAGGATACPDENRPEHDRLVSRMLAHMEAHGLTQAAVLRAMKLKGSKQLSLWLGRSQQTLAPALQAEIDAQIAAYLDAAVPPASMPSGASTLGGSDLLLLPETYAVSHLVDVKSVNRRRQFRVRWVGYTAADDTWESEASILSPNLIANYERLSSSGGDVRAAVLEQMARLGVPPADHSLVLGADVAAYLHGAPARSAEGVGAATQTLREWLESRWDAEAADGAAANAAGTAGAAGAVGATGSVRCNGCERLFNTPQALSAHRRYCRLSSLDKHVVATGDATAREATMGYARACATPHTARANDIAAANGTNGTKNGAGSANDPGGSAGARVSAGAGNAAGASDTAGTGDAPSTSTSGVVGTAGSASAVASVGDFECLECHHRFATAVARDTHCRACSGGGDRAYILQLGATLEAMGGCRQLVRGRRPGWLPRRPLPRGPSAPVCTLAGAHSPADSMHPQPPSLPSRQNTTTHPPPSLSCLPSPPLPPPSQYTPILPPLAS